MENIFKHRMVKIKIKLPTETPKYFVHDSYIITLMCTLEWNQTCLQDFMKRV